MTPIGVEFPSLGAGQGRYPADWDGFYGLDGFSGLKESRKWSEIRHKAADDGDAFMYDIASRCTTYLNLMGIRLKEISASYERTLRAILIGDWKEGNLFANAFLRDIDASVHAFVSDAGGYRDLLAEISWFIVSSTSEKVTRLSSFLRETQSNDHPLALEFHDAGESGGWLNDFTNLRNNIVHTTPVGASHFSHSCTIRMHDLSDGVSVPKLHYPLLNFDHSLPPTEKLAFPMTEDNEPKIVEQLRSYSSFVSSSTDALTYIWHTITRLIRLNAAIRGAGNFKGKALEITDADIIGEPKFGI